MNKLISKTIISHSIGLEQWSAVFCLGSVRIGYWSYRAPPFIFTSLTVVIIVNITPYTNLKTGGEKTAKKELKMN